MALENTIAYYDMATIMIVKSFIVQAPDAFSPTIKFAINNGIVSAT